MNISDAIRTRINEYVKDDKTLTSICLNSGITPSTIFDFMYGKTKYPTIITLKKLCLGLNITLKEFFSKDYFDDDVEVL